MFITIGLGEDWARYPPEFPSTLNYSMFLRKAKMYMTNTTLKLLSMIKAEQYLIGKSTTFSPYIRH